MNREFLPEAVLGITLGLLVAVLAVYRTAKDPSKGVLTRGAMVAVVVYAVIAAQVLVTEGMTLVGMLLLVVMLCLPVAGMLLADRTGRVVGPAADVARALVSIGLAAAMLIAAGQALSMLSLVDPRTLVIVVAAVTGLLVAAEGAVASGRIGSLAVWLLILPIVLVLALAVLLGNVGQAFSPIIVTDALSPATVVGLMVALLVLGSADAALAASHRAGQWSPVRVLGGAVGIVVLLAFGMLMFFGGAIVAPSLQFFVLPANLDALPGLMGVMLLVLTMLFAGLVAAGLSGLRPDVPPTDADSPRAASARWQVLAIGVVAAVVVALVNPGMDSVVVGAGLVAAALFGATADRGVLVAMVTAAVLAVVLAATGTLTWGWWAALATAGVALVGRISSRGAEQAPLPENQPEAVGR